MDVPFKGQLETGGCARHRPGLASLTKVCCSSRCASPFPLSPTRGDLGVRGVLPQELIRRHACPFMFYLRFAVLCLRSVDTARRILAHMADFLVVLGTLLFVLVSFGLIWALDRV